MLILEFILEKKYVRYRAESSIPEERIIAIRIKVDKSVKVGSMWSPAVVDFYKEIYPDLIEDGFTLEQIEDLYDWEQWFEGLGD